MQEGKQEGLVDKIDKQVNIKEITMTNLYLGGEDLPDDYTDENANN